MKHTLHLLTKNSTPTFIENDAAIVLMQDAVYLLLQQPVYKLLYVIKNDLLARGLDGNNAKVIDYDELVTLTTEYDQVITWT